MRKTILLLAVVGLLLGGCEENNTTVLPDPVGATSPDCPLPLIPESVVFDVTPGDGLGNVEGVDSTPGASSHEWVLPTCSPDRSARPTFSTVCPTGVLNWRLTITDACAARFFTSGSTPVT